MDKPMFIFIKPDKDGNFKLTEEEFKHYLEQSFGLGFADGFSQGVKSNQPLPVTPQSPTSPYSPPSTWPYIPTWYYSPTCTGVVTNSVKVTGEQNEQR